MVFEIYNKKDDLINSGLKHITLLADLFAAPFYIKLGGRELGKEETEIFAVMLPLSELLCKSKAVFTKRIFPNMALLRFHLNPT